MAFPASLTLITVNVRADLLPGGGSTGWARLRYDGLPLTGPTADSIVAYVDETEEFAADGTTSIQVPATNATGWTPQNFTYEVTVCSGSRVRRGTVQLDRGTTTVNLADVIQWEGAAESGVTYATVAQLAAVQSDLDVAEAAIVSAAATANLASAGSVKATDYGLTGWTFPMSQIQAATVLGTSGLSYVVRIRALAATVSAINLHFTAGGSGLSNCFASLHSDAGVILGAGAVSLDQSSTWNSGGYKTCPLVATQAVTPYSLYRVRFWFNGTGPSVSRGVNSSGPAVNGALVAPNFFFSTADAGLTTSGTAPGTIGTQTSGATAFWVGLTP